MQNDEVTPNIFVSPADRRNPAAQFSAKSDTNISYFIGVDNKEDRPGAVLAGDWNLDGGLARQDCPVAGINNVVVTFSYAQIPNARWSAAVHRQSGNVAIGDGSAHQASSALVREMLLNSDDNPAAKNFNNNLLKPR